MKKTWCGGDSSGEERKEGTGRAVRKERLPPGILMTLPALGREGLVWGSDSCRTGGGTSCRENLAR